MKKDELKDTSYMVTGTFAIHSFPITMLFDSGVSHSFVAFGIADKLKLVPSYNHLLYLLLYLCET